MIPPGLRHRVAEHAASGALRDLLEHYRLSYSPEPLSEGAIFGFSGALDLRVRIADAAVPTIDLDGRAPSLEPELCEHLGIAAQWHTTSDPMTGWELLQAELAAGNPVLVHADLAELDYRQGDRHDTRHAIVVTSWDADGGRRLGRRRKLSRAAALQPARARRRARLAGLAGARPPRRCSPCARGPSGSPTRTRPSRRRCGRVIEAMRHPRPPGPSPRAARGSPPPTRSPPRGRGCPTPRARGSARRSPRCASASATAAPAARCIARCRRASCTRPPPCSAPPRSATRRSSATTSPTPGARSPASIEGDDPAFAHRVGAPWVQRICALEHAHVEALEEHLRIHRAIAA